MAQQTFDRTNVYKDFDLSFTFNPLTGDIGSKTDVNAINQSIRNLINTNFYERPFKPEMGSNIRAILFEQADVITTLDLKQSITEVITNYEPRVTLQDVIIQDEPDKNAYNISIIYLINGQNNVAQFDTILKRLR
tara:strand:- start:13320 stop:13724 length:405 start_codon:yes stop_codon:yes gene_type:complete